MTSIGLVIPEIAFEILEFEEKMNAFSWLNQKCYCFIGWGMELFRA